MMKPIALTTLSPGATGRTQPREPSLRRCSAGEDIANAALGKAIALAREAIPIQDVDFANEQIVFEHTSSAPMLQRNSWATLNAPAWLANKLSLRGLMLKEGDIVMSGAISKLVRLQIGDTVTAKFTKLNSVGVTVVV
jgi:2-keto-4-pentenoate hydratase